MRRSALLALALGACGPTTAGAPPVLAPADFTLIVRGTSIALDRAGAVHAEGCEAHLDFATATLETDGRALGRLEGEAWPRALVLDGGSPPVLVDESSVRVEGRALFALEGGRLVDLGGGTTPAPEIVATGLEPEETTTALALLALIDGCWEH